jgi:hypothetical protein
MFRKSTVSENFVYIEIGIKCIKFKTKIESIWDVDVKNNKRW